MDEQTQKKIEEIMAAKTAEKIREKMGDPPPISLREWMDMDSHTLGEVRGAMRQRMADAEQAARAAGGAVGLELEEWDRIGAMFDQAGGDREKLDRANDALAEYWKRKKREREADAERAEWNARMGRGQPEGYWRGDTPGKMLDTCRGEDVTVELIRAAVELVAAVDPSVGPVGQTHAAACAYLEGLFRALTPREAGVSVGPGRVAGCLAQIRAYAQEALDGKGADLGPEERAKLEGRLEEYLQGLTRYMLMPSGPCRPTAKDEGAE